MNKFIICLLILWGLSACSAGGPGSAKPGNETGLCPINCGKAIVGSNDSVFSIRPLFESVSIQCPSEDQTVPLRLQWIATEKYKEGDVENYRPVPYLSFEVVAPGLREIDSEGNVDERVETASELRCSDACGVMTVDINPSCPGATKSRTVSILVHSGPLYPETNTEISIATD